MIVKQNAYAVAPGIRASFHASGGDEPYLYEVLPDGAGGTIDPATGAYRAPLVLNEDPVKGFDVIRVTDYSNEVVETTIRVCTPLLLVCEIIEREMALPNGSVYLYSQKKMMPTNTDIFVAVSIDKVNYYGSSTKGVTEDDGDTFTSAQWVVYSATLGIDITSRDTKVLFRKDEVVLALNSEYSKMQQSRNTFGIARLPASNMVPRPIQDGAAIPYRFYFQVNVNFGMPKGTPIEFYDTFQNPELFIDS
jgi:hypothetical protein